MMYTVTVMYMKGRWNIQKEVARLPFIPQRGNLIRLHGEDYRVDVVHIDLDKEGEVTIELDKE